jgi:hypothetical protein
VCVVVLGCRVIHHAAAADVEALAVLSRAIVNLKTAVQDSKSAGFPSRAPDVSPSRLRSPAASTAPLLTSVNEAIAHISSLTSTCITYKQSQEAQEATAATLAHSSSDLRQGTVLCVARCDVHMSQWIRAPSRYRT